MNIRKLAAGSSVALLAIALVLYGVYRVHASDHQDSPATMARPGADITDVYLFPAAGNPNDVIVALDVHPLIPAGQATTAYFDPGVLYQLKFDTSTLNGNPPGTPRENMVVQFRAGQPGSAQRVEVYAGAPKMTGTTNMMTAHIGGGSINRTFKAANMTIFAGAREDPFFFDLAQFLKILPDRAAGSKDASCLPGLGNGNCPQGFNPAGTASDTLANYNVLSLVVEMPRAMLGGKKVALWATTSTSEPGYSGATTRFAQIDRLARPAVNEVFATFARHDVNNRDNPSDDETQLKNDIASFMKNVAGRSDAISGVLQTVLVPDVLVADLSQPGSANYLGVETGGASSPTKSTFGGRALNDDIVDVSLQAVFGNIVPALKLAPDDGKELDGTGGKPQLTTDNVGPGAKHFKAGFPYLGDPR